ncbi:hypothetical protein B566_EDAN000858 [Ephemera danica]|nr:hypothetical protein B566_EDAN000858 [Ephemera danica]
MLIDEYKNNREELENPTTGTKSAIWEKIAEKFNEKWNSNFSADMCANKWRSMKNTYKRVRYSQRPDHSKKRWEYYEALSDVYKNVKLAKPNSRVLGGAASGQQAVHIVQFAPQSSSSAGRSYSPIRLCPEPTSFNYDSEPPSWFKEFIQEYHKSEDVKLKMLQQIHKDIVRIGERQCVALEKLAEELKN